MSNDAQIFESHRPDLLTLAYRMLGELGRAEDVVQEAWVRWQKRADEVEAPKAFLIKVVTRGRIRRVFLQADPARLKHVGLVH